MSKIETYIDGTLTQVEYKNNNDKLHNTNGPASVRFNKSGQKVSEEYCIDGITHNTNGPAFIVWHNSGQKESEEYCINGKLHNENGPARIYWYENSHKEYEAYYINGKCHNENGPAYIYWHEDGQKKSETYYIKGNLYNKNGPAIIRWRNNGQKSSESYWIDDKLHNTNGPAIIGWDKHGQKWNEEYWVDGKEISEGTFQKQYKQELKPLVSEMGGYCRICNEYNPLKLPPKTLNNDIIKLVTKTVFTIFENQSKELVQAAPLVFIGLTKLVVDKQEELKKLLTPIVIGIIADQTQVECKTATKHKNLNYQAQKYVEQAIKKLLEDDNNKFLLSAGVPIGKLFDMLNCPSTSWDIDSKTGRLKNVLGLSSTTRLGMVLGSMRDKMSKKGIYISSYRKRKDGFRTQNYIITKDINS